ILAAVDTYELDEAGIEGFISRLTQDFLRICGFPIHCVLWDKDTDVLKLAARFRDNRNAALDYKYAFSKVKEYIKSGEAASALHVVKNIAEQRQLKGQDLYRFACDVIDILKENEFPSGSLIDEFHVKARGVSDEKLLSLLGELFKHLSDEMSALTYNEYYITYAQKYISENLCENISLEKVAESVALSPAYFSRYFREITGSRFIDYLCQVRVDKAKELLLSPEVKVSDIHELVGYHSRSRFYALFQEKTGLTPHEYRRQHLNRI
ncbi:MAG: helix-turn-helix domain-containing protein, partial [Clostridiales bacterium]|nr:helix-turn-helix domain-containing protein [Clostridiales bacterium]